VQIGWILEPKCDAKLRFNFQLNKFGRMGWEEMAICPHLMAKNTHVGGGNDEFLERNLHIRSSICFSVLE